MCCGSSTTTNTSSTQVDPKLRAMAEEAFGKVSTVADQPYVPYRGDRVADFTPDQQSSFNMLRVLAQGFDPGVGEQATDFAEQYATAPGQSVSVSGAAPTVGVSGQGTQISGYETPNQELSTSRLVDEGSRLGSISDYMNPFLAEALDPAIRDIGESGAKLRNEIAASSTMAGAFGDARHGIVEGEQMRGEQRTIGDLSAQMRASGFDRAMGLRSADEQRFMGADTFNSLAGERDVERILSGDIYNSALGERDIGREFSADVYNAGSEERGIDRELGADQFTAEAAERAIERLLSGAGGMMDAQRQGLDTGLASINPLLATGTQQQQQNQQELNTGYEDYLQNYDHPYKNMALLLAALSGQPYSANTTQTTSQPNNSGLGVLGSIFSSLF